MNQSSSPKEEFLIKNPSEFFSFCDKCLKEEVHICSEDSIISNNNSSPLFGILGITISKLDTLISLKMIVPNMSAGPNGIPGILLKNCADSLAHPLTLFWNESMRLKKVPARLKEAWVFDVVDKGILSHRMKEKGIEGEIGAWIYDFLSNRIQRVLVDDNLSTPSKVTSGVPQGTVLGPLLFLLLIDSLGEVEIDALIVAFADDSKVTLPIHSIDESIKLQQNMEWNVSMNGKNKVICSSIAVNLKS